MKLGDLVVITRDMPQRVKGSLYTGNIAMLTKICDGYFHVKIVYPKCAFAFTWPVGSTDIKPIFLSEIEKLVYGIS